jgi:hypothetical protein
MYKTVLRHDKRGVLSAHLGAHLQTIPLYRLSGLAARAHCDPSSIAAYHMPLQDPDVRDRRQDLYNVCDDLDRACRPQNARQNAGSAMSATTIGCK